ncbi:transcriptional regulator family: Fungal Specific TF [Penicillium macrosclerotiorum]|uniref:transcriptional regulator family: Fungal Specific TF n=1 Tax=Penicillium macrosclerotiorum TaxID=303699 RepID=UPI0025493639|nr:transcriptional regulator family: Fungal Specific TF [Penicillium macrosclerotiorum]KAJ5682995.1 transcriptional regulator family: Fungal Specific TF [Penicillium macrosclerotiorum]
MPELPGIQESNVDAVIGHRRSSLPFPAIRIPHSAILSPRSELSSQTLLSFFTRGSRVARTMNPSPPNLQSLSRATSSGRPPSSARGPLAGGRHITRNRASYSCHTCRRRKVKCDKVHPVCGNCAKVGDECVYDTSSQKNQEVPEEIAQPSHGVKRRRGAPRSWENDVDELQTIYGNLKNAGTSNEPKADPRAIEARLDKLMTMIERLGGTPRALEEAERQGVVGSSGVDAALLEQLRQGRASGGRLVSSRPSSPRRAGAESSGDEFPIPSGQATDLVDPVGSLNLGHLSLEDGGRSRYVGTTYWAYISHEINDLNQLLRDQNRSHDITSENADDDTHEPILNDRRSWNGPGGSMSSTSPRPRIGSFQKSIIFPSGDSPSINEKLVEPEMLDHVPTRRQSHILYKGFMSGVHAISPVIHPPTILKLYNSFWDWYDYSSYSGESCPNPSFIPLLYAIWYGGSVTVSIRTLKAEFNAPSRFALSTLYSEEVTRWLTKISFPRSPSLQGLAAYLIVQTILSKEEEPLTSSLFVSLAMRVAQTMGLHRDPAKFGIEPSEAEYRRRLWWHIMHMDGVVAMSSGLPPLVSDENYWDVRETSEIKDTLLGTPAAERYEQLLNSGRLPDNPDDPSLCGGPSMVNVFYLTARGKYIMARAVRRILKIQLGIKPVTRQDMEELRAILLDLQLKLNSIVSRIPEGHSSSSAPVSMGRELSMSKSPVESRSTDTELPGEGPNCCPEQYHSSVLVCFHKWARIILSLYIDKAFCVAYQPFLKNARSRIWPAARQSALRHCHGFMEKFIQLATDPDFQPFQWSWPGNHQPMHATMIMLIDLYERPYSPEASRSRAFIDRILALSGPDGGVVGGEDGVSTQRPLKDGGREAWDMIRRLRQKAWQKAGLNPQMLWTEQDQIQAGVASPAAEPQPFRGPLYSNPPSNAASPIVSGGPPRQALVPDRQLTDFNRLFNNMTRSHIPSGPSISSALPRPSPLRYSYQAPPSCQRPVSLPSQYNPTPAAMAMPGSSALSPSSAMATSPELSSSIGSPPSNYSPTTAAPAVPTAQSPRPHLNRPSSPQMPFMDPISPNPPSRGVPTPPLWWTRISISIGINGTLCLGSIFPLLMNSWN